MSLSTLRTAGLPGLLLLPVWLIVRLGSPLLPAANPLKGVGFAALLRGATPSAYAGGALLWVCLLCEAVACAVLLTSP